MFHHTLVFVILSAAMVGAVPQASRLPAAAHSNAIAMAAAMAVDDIFFPQDPRYKQLRRSGIRDLMVVDPTFAWPMLLDPVYGQRKPAGVRYKDWRGSYNTNQPMTPLFQTPHGSMVWVGCLNAALDTGLLAENGINCRWCVKDGYELYRRAGFSDLPTIGANSIVEGEKDAGILLRALDECITKLLSCNIVVHCLQGANRSPFICCCVIFLFTHEFHAMEDIMEYVQKLRGIADMSSPAPGGYVYPMTFFGEIKEQLVDLAHRRHLPQVRLPEVVGAREFEDLAQSLLPRRRMAPSSSSGMPLPRFAGQGSEVDQPDTLDEDESGEGFQVAGNGVEGEGDSFQGAGEREGEGESFEGDGFEGESFEGEDASFEGVPEQCHGEEVALPSAPEVFNGDAVPKFLNKITPFPTIIWHNVI